MSDKAQKLIFDFLLGRATRSDLDRFEKQGLANSKRVPVKQAAEASLEDLQLWFGIALMNRDPELGWISPKPMPKTLVRELSMVRRALGNDTPSKTSARIIVERLLIHAHAIATEELSCEAYRRVYLHTERTWGIRVKNAKLVGEFDLVGRPDFAFWYGPMEETELNIVVVADDAKAAEKPELGLAQCLAYMSMIHMKRKEAGKQRCTVYGACARDQSFEFLKIDEQGIASHRHVDAPDGNYATCLGIFVHFLQVGPLMSLQYLQESPRQTHVEGSRGSGSIYFDNGSIM